MENTTSQKKEKGDERRIKRKKERETINLKSRYEKKRVSRKEKRLNRCQTNDKTGISQGQVSQEFGRGCGSQFLAENARQPCDSPLSKDLMIRFTDGNPRSRRSISKRFPRLFIVGSPRVRLPTMVNLAKRVFHRVLKIFYSFERREREREEERKRN